MAIKDQTGQATVELAVLFPIVIIIAVIAVNALLFFGHCASFDRTFRQVVSTVASSPAAGQSTVNTKALIENALHENFQNNNLEFEVAVGEVSGHFKNFDGTIKMYPTLFGLGLKKEIFGVSLPTLNHKCQMAVDVYKPGVIL
ncbi:MAG: hypothetical protein Q4E88_04810 [Coriobacteriia bacterium]|nr:hypothetical protein [Coriobacteriia bacterium]